MNRSLIKKAAALLAGLTLAACAMYPSTTPVATEPDLVGTRIAQASEKAAQALDTISGIEQQRTPLPMPEDYSNAPPSMMQLITVKWTGPVEQITQTLATRAGLRFQTKGTPPAVPLTVSINAYKQPMIELLRDLGLQVGRRADITVDGQNGVIEIRYAPVDRI